MSNKSFHQSAKCIHRPRRERRDNPLYPCIGDTCVIHGGHRDDRRDTFVCVYSAAACNPRNKIQKNGRRMRKRRDVDVERMRCERFRARASCARARLICVRLRRRTHEKRDFFSPPDNAEPMMSPMRRAHYTAPIKLHASFLVMRVFSNVHN